MDDINIRDFSSSDREKDIDNQLRPLTFSDFRGQVKIVSNLEVFVTEYLKVRIEGSGSVYYRGNPELDVFIDGSGDVVDDN